MTLEAMAPVFFFVAMAFMLQQHNIQGTATTLRQEVVDFIEQNPYFLWVLFLIFIF